MAREIALSPETPRRNYTVAIQVLTTIFALLYVVFVVLSFIPSPQGSPIADHPYTPWDTEMITVKLLFALFMTGYYFSWKSRMISGLIYLIWCAALIWQSFYISSKLHVAGDGIMFAAPILVIALIQIITALVKGK